MTEKRNRGPGRGTIHWKDYNGLCYDASVSGYGLVVKRVLAKDQSGVRFSLSAHDSAKERESALLR